MIPLAPPRPAGIDGTLRVALIGLACLAGPAAGQSLEGRVLDARTGQGVGSATVDVRNPATEIVTAVSSDGSGAFRIPLAAAGRYQLMVRHVGFDPATIELRVPPAGPVHLEILLEPRAIPMDSVTVTADPLTAFLEDVGFGRRSGGGQGVFITRRDIEESGAHRTSELLQGKVGIRFLRSGLGGGDARFTRGAYQGCPPQLLLNGARVRRGNSGRGRLDVTIDALVAPSQIAGIELYTGPAEIPLEFGGTGAACGVILIWLRP